MRTLYLLIIFLSTAVLNGQNRKYGKITKEEVEVQKSSSEPDAAAEVIYETAVVAIEYSVTERTLKANKEVEGRIKIYDKDRADDELFTVEVPLYISSGADREKLIEFKGATANIEGGKLVSTKVKNSDIFTDRKNKRWETQTMTFPNVKNGSVIEYRYVVETPFFFDLGRWFFQRDIPVQYSSYKLIAPEQIVFSNDFRGGITPKIKTDRITNFQFGNTEAVTEYILEKIPSLKDEPYVLNSDNMMASLRYEIMKLEYPGIITQNYSTTWTQIGKDLMDSPDFGGQLKGNNFLDETVNSLIAGADTPFDKTSKIFNYVKNNFAWDKFNSIIPDNGLRQTFKNKTGNAADINMLLVSMLQKAGIDAAPVVLSTVNNLIINYSFPSRSSLNFLIASAVINDKLYLMDATEKFSDINMLPLRDLNQRGFRITDKGVQEIPLTNYSLSTSKISINAALESDGSISGNFSEVRDMYFAMSDKMAQSDNPKSFEKRYLRNYNFDPEGFKIDENAEKGIIRYSFKFEDLQGGDAVGNKIIVNPMLFEQLTKNSFTHDSRSYPLEFGTAANETTIIKIKIPDGYKVESLPQQKQHLVQGDVAGYAYQVQEQNGYIVVTTVFQLSQSSLPPTYYQPMKELEKQQIAAEAQQLVLVKE